MKRASVFFVFFPIVLTINLWMARAFAIDHKWLGHKDPSFIDLFYENDTFAGTDKNYTNGVAIRFRNFKTPPDDLKRAAQAFPLFGFGIPTKTGEYGYGYGFAQQMFTPDNIGSSDLQDRDRPFAGWLNGSIFVNRMVPIQPEKAVAGQFEQLELKLGVVRPASLAGTVQRAVHRVVDATPPRGWRHQLPNEPAFVLNYDRFWYPALLSRSPDPIGYSLSPRAGLSLGTVRVSARIGLDLTIGNVIENLGAGSISTPSPRNPGFLNYMLSGKGRPIGWAFFVGLQGKAVAHDIFLDGSVIRSSHSIGSLPFVFEARVGAALYFDRFRLSFTYNRRTQEFRDQHGLQGFASVSLSTAF